jgi:uncharacterized repeat protein (TIGR03803 family)
VGGGAYGGGTVFRLTPPSGTQTVWAEDILASLPVGAAPQSTPAFGPGNLLYFTTTAGGANGFGRVLSLRPPAGGAAPWILAGVHDFTGGADGEVPLGGFTVSGLRMYGTTSGGDDTAGTVFTVTK